MMFIQLTIQIAEKQNGGHCTKIVLALTKCNAGLDTNMNN